MQWPDEIKAGQKISSTRASHCDIFTTIAKAAEKGEGCQKIKESSDIMSKEGNKLDVELLGQDDGNNCRIFSYGDYNYDICSIEEDERRKRSAGSSEHLPKSCGDLKSRFLCGRATKLLGSRTMDGTNLLRFSELLNENKKDKSNDLNDDDSIRGDNSSVMTTSPSLSLNSNMYDDKNRIHYFRSGHYRCIIQRNWKLQVSFNPLKAWLFDLNTDPLEEHNKLGDENEWWFLQLMELSVLHPLLFTQRRYGYIEENFVSNCIIFIRNVLMDLFMIQVSACRKISSAGS
jgi:arylsulfatase A-like enzyme